MNDSIERNHYNTPRWERYAEVEHNVADGVTLKDRVEKEVGLAINHGNLNLKPGDRVLDLASGTGLHTVELAKRTGAKVEGRDLANILVEQAKAKLANDTSAITDDVRNRVSFATGNYGKIRESLSPDEKFKCITCFGTSFIYLRSHEEYMAALRDYFDLLESGGKLVLQWREKNPKVNPKSRIGITEEAKKYNTEYRELQPGKIDTLNRKATSGVLWKSNPENPDESYGMYVTEGDNPPPPLHPYRDIFGEAGTIPYESFGRVYVDAKGEETPESSTMTLNYLDRKRLPVIQRMLQEVGFKNVKLIPENKDGEPLSIDGYRTLFALVAEKP